MDTTGDKMPFTKEQWAEQARANISSSRNWFHKGDVPFLIYGMVAGLTLWPLVDAAARTPAGQSIPLALLITLGNVVSGIGANLIAEQLGCWRDPPHPVAAADVIAWVQAQAATQTDVRQALDEMLETFQAIPQAQNSLSAADKIWFNQQLQAEMAQLGNLPRFVATVSGGARLLKEPGQKRWGKGECWLKVTSLAPSLPERGILLSPVHWRIW